MASEREFSFCDKVQNNRIVSALFEQKTQGTFCDVIMKVCTREILAHSVILAAASPYFSAFLTQDLPRLFSQRSPQVIEIQIDGSEPNNLYEEAVSAVVDFIYTGQLKVMPSNVSQICEIGRIMQMDNIVNYCTEILEGKVLDPHVNDDSPETGSNLNIPNVFTGGIMPQLHVGEGSMVAGAHMMERHFTDVGTSTDPSDLEGILRSKYSTSQSVRTKMGDPAFHAKIKAKQLVSVSCQVYPHLLPEGTTTVDNFHMHDQATSTDNRYFETMKELEQSPETRLPSSLRGKKRKADHIPVPQYQTYQLIHTEDGSMFLSKEDDQVTEQQVIEINVPMPAMVNETSGNQEVLKSMEVVAEIDREIDGSPAIGEIMVESVQDNHIKDEAEQWKKSKIIEPEVQEEIILHSKQVGSHHGDNDGVDSVAITDIQTPRRSSRRCKPTSRMQEFHDLQELHGTQLQKIKEELTEVLPHNLLSENIMEIVPNIVETVNINPSEEGEMDMRKPSEEVEVLHTRSEQEEAAVRLLSLADHIVQNSPAIEHMEVDDDYNEHDESDNEHDESFREVTASSKLKSHKSSTRRSSTKMTSGNLVQIGLGKYQCDICSYNTNKVRQMSAHIKLHKLESNICYYCEQKFPNKEILSDHMDQHKGPVPFFCHVCGMRFKSRTLLNMHLPKHSDDKPFICHVCSMGFKWKHALKTHMITHTNKKEHLCDTCGYATAHKSQLKAHRKIHSGDMLKCHYADCNFLATKTQNMKYHLLTHTKEKPHQCDMCGQNFSLVKNLRRHLLLHAIDKKQGCPHCTFNSTRVDKLKEHLLKMHGIGTPPERRQRVTDMVINAAQIVTKRARTALPKVSTDVRCSTIKTESQLMEQVESSIVSVDAKSGVIHEIDEISCEYPQTLTEEATLIEIIEENGQPMRILRNQPILIAHPSDRENDSILQEVDNEVMQTKPTSAAHGLVIAESVVSSVSTGNQIGNTIQTTDDIDLECVETVSEDQLTYAEMVEVPVEQVIEMAGRSDQK